METMLPDVSVVMGVYNGEAYLKRSVDSVLGQDRVNFELVVVDDGSTDGTAEILKGYAKRDSRVRVISQDKAGLTMALIRGCREARGEFIARQDADDVSLPGRLHRLIDLMRSDGRIQFASSWAYVFGPHNELLCEMKRPDDPALATSLLLQGRAGPPGHGTVMFRRDGYERVGGYREQFYYSQDGDLWLRLAEIGSLAYSPHFLYAYLYSLDSISSSRRTAQKRLVLIAHECMRARSNGQNEGPLLEKALRIRPPFQAPTRRDVERGPYFIAGCLRERRDRRAVEYYRGAIRASPWDFWAWFWLIYSAFARRRWGYTDLDMLAGKPIRVIP